MPGVESLRGFGFLKGLAILPLPPLREPDGALGVLIQRPIYSFLTTVTSIFFLP